MKKLLRFFCGFFVIIKEILKNILIIQIKFSFLEVTGCGI